MKKESFPTDIKVEGWTNYQTWNIALVIDNHESLYLKKISRINKYIEKEMAINAPTVRSFFGLYRVSEWIDFPMKELTAVNWEEIADEWNTLLEEMKRED